MSTFANYHLYFKNWLYASLKLAVYNATVLLGEEIQVSSSLTKFLRVKTRLEEGKLCAFRIPENGSGDLISLVSCDGFVHLSPGTVIYQKGDVVPFTPTRRIV